MHNDQDSIYIGAEGTEYGNWMSMPAVRMGAGITMVSVAAFILVIVLSRNVAASIVLGAVASVCVAFFIYILKVRRAFSFTGGRVMDKIHQYLVSHLEWDGQGKLLDIGCGSAPLSIRCAKTFTDAQITGIDYWGKMWDYSKNLCEKNARLEGVADRCGFQNGDAAALDFPDGEFDAIVSNFVYHEVRNGQDKKDLILESFRVLKKGGAFALQDFYNREKMFGNPDEMIAYFKEQGISEIHYEPDLDKQSFVPAVCATPMIIKGAGLIWGKK